MGSELKVHSTDYLFPVTRQLKYPIYVQMLFLLQDEKRMTTSLPLAIYNFQYWHCFALNSSFGPGGGIMRRRSFTNALFLVSICVFISIFCSLRVSRNSISFSSEVLKPESLPKDVTSRLNPDSSGHVKVIMEDVKEVISHSFSVFLPNWEVLVLVSPATLITSSPQFYCHFPRNEISPANFSGILPFTNLTTFKCSLPKRNRESLSFYQPVLMNSPEKNSANTSTAMEMPLWKLFVYESFSTESDVILFVKGINYRPGINRLPGEFSCVFGDDAGNAIKTDVTSSMQEVFRCNHPNMKSADRIKVSLQIKEENRVLHSGAYYSRNPTRLLTKTKSLLYITTMVYNVAKYLREWVMYYSAIGIEKFFLYDNESDDDLERVIQELNKEGYNIERIFWIWPKTQEGGFSHSAVFCKDSCKWMMYVDVDEFIYSPLWLPNISSNPQPSKFLLTSLLPSSDTVGQVSIKSNEFGPSGHKKHPGEGVIQGYTCRRRHEQLHKSIIRLDAVDHSLLNVVHHFSLNVSRYRLELLSPEVAVVNHYKYQAWPEFMTKFRRRVSAFATDWMIKDENPMSQDGTTGLKSQPVKPKNWEHKFCQEKDERLKQLTQIWFGSQTHEGLKMSWQR